MNLPVLNKNRILGFPGGDWIVSALQGLADAIDSAWDKQHTTAGLHSTVTATGSITTADRFYEKNRTTPSQAVGYWTDLVYDPSMFTAAGSMTWTVSAASVKMLRYTLVGKTMTLAWNLSGTTVGGVLSTQLQLPLPAGYTIASTFGTTNKTQQYANLYRLSDNGVVTTGFAFALDNGSFISLQRLDAANFTASAANTAMQGELTFEVQ